MGGGGIGSATCRRFADEGAKVAVWDLAGDAANAVADAITGNGGQAVAVAADITDLDAVQAGVAGIAEKLGDIDILINNAGWDMFKPFLQTDPEFWRKVIDINLVGPLNMHYAILPGMAERGYGRVVSISSDAGRVGSSGESVYAACKAGILGFSKTLAREHARQGITFNVVCPGPTDTALFANYSEGAGNPEKTARGHETGHSRWPDRDAGGPAGGDRVSGQRRRRLYHRTGHQRVRRSDHERIRMSRNAI